MEEKTFITGFKKYSRYMDSLVDVAKSLSNQSGSISMSNFEAYGNNIEHYIIEGLNIYYNLNTKKIEVSEEELYDAKGIRLSPVVHMEKEARGCSMIIIDEKERSNSKYILWSRRKSL